MATQLWSGTVNSEMYRLIDLGQTGGTERFIIEKLIGHDTLGGETWSKLNLPFADVLQAAFLAFAKL